MYLQSGELWVSECVGERTNHRVTPVCLWNLLGFTYTRTVNYDDSYLGEDLSQAAR